MPSNVNNEEGKEPVPKEDGTTANTTKRTKSIHHRVAGKKGYVSPRGASNLALAMPYLADFFASLQDMCHPETNPQGYVPVAVAENRLVTDLLHAKLTTLEAAQAGFDHPEVYSYNDPQGLPVFREVLANFFQERFLKTTTRTSITSSTTTTTTIINPKHIAIGAGAINILSSLFFALGDTGDAVLIPAPYYAAFDNDLRAFAGCRTVPVVCQNPALGPTADELETAKAEAERSGWNVRFLLLTHPHNPLGVVYQPQVIQDAIAWARSYSMDTIVDEIYALSVFDNQDDFKSIIELYNNDLGDDLHLVWGLSKDFGASGFRVGVLYSQNELLMEAMGNLIVFAWVSLPMQRLMADLLNDKPFVDSFLKESCQRLKQSYELCTSVLDDLKIPYVKATAAMFVYLDLSNLIQSEQEEATLSRLFMTRARMVLTPGTTQHDPQPGKYRICYAYVSPEVLQIGMERFRKMITKIRDQGGLGDWVDDDAHWHDIL